MATIKSNMAAASISNNHSLEVFSMFSDLEVIYINLSLASIHRFLSTRNLLYNNNNNNGIFIAPITQYAKRCCQLSPIKSNMATIKSNLYSPLPDGDKNICIESRSSLYHKYLERVTGINFELSVAILDFVAAILDSISDIVIQWHHLPFL